MSIVLPVIIVHMYAEIQNHRYETSVLLNVFQLVFTDPIQTTEVLLSYMRIGSFHK
jgi:hypothetical protein